MMPLHGMDTHGYDKFCSCCPESLKFKQLLSHRIHCKSQLILKGQCRFFKIKLLKLFACLLKTDILKRAYMILYCLPLHAEATLRIGFQNRFFSPLIAFVDMKNEFYFCSKPDTFFIFLIFLIAMLNLKKCLVRQKLLY